MSVPGYYSIIKFKIVFLFLLAYISVYRNGSVYNIQNVSYFIVNYRSNHTDALCAHKTNTVSKHSQWVS